MAQNKASNMKKITITPIVAPLPLWCRAISFVSVERRREAADAVKEEAHSHYGTGIEARGPRSRSKEHQSLSFPQGQTALLVIDPVNDFLSEGALPGTRLRPR